MEFWVAVLGPRQNRWDKEGRCGRALVARPYRPSSYPTLFRRAPKESERDGSPPTLEEGETGHRSEPLMSSLWWAGVEVEEEEGFVDPLMFSTVEDIVVVVVLVVSLCGGFYG